MRKSFAPSFQGKHNIYPKSKVIGEGKTRPINFLDEKKSSTRSTSSILDLLNNHSFEEEENDESSINQSKFDLTLISEAARSKQSPRNDQDNSEVDPSLVFEEETVSAPVSPDGNTSAKRIYNVVWGKLSKKKHKTWEGDGVIEVCSSSVLLKDSEGKCIGTKRRVNTDILEEGSRLVIGAKEVELIDLVNPVPIITVKKREVEWSSPEHSAPALGSHKRPRTEKTMQLDSLQDDMIEPIPSTEYQGLEDSP